MSKPNWAGTGRPDGAGHLDWSALAEGAIDDLIDAVDELPTGTDVEAAIDTALSEPAPVAREGSGANAVVRRSALDDAIDTATSEYAVRLLSINEHGPDAVPADYPSGATTMAVTEGAWPEDSGTVTTAVGTAQRAVQHFASRLEGRIYTRTWLSADNGWSRWLIPPTAEPDVRDVSYDAQGQVARVEVGPHVYDEIVRDAGGVERFNFNGRTYEVTRNGDGRVTGVEATA